jgi:phosphoglycerate dehydrogenase-like enzyme
VLVLAPRYGEMLREVWPLPSGLRWIHALGAGVESLPFDLLRETDIVVTNSRGVYADALAEFVVAAIMWFAKGLPRLARNQREKKWEPFVVQRLEGATLGIVGYGSIGRAVAARLAPMGMSIAGATRHGDTLLDDVLAQSDYVVVSTPLTEETHHLISSRRIALLKPEAVLINISRGSVVDEAALIDALRSRRIGGAALDVFETEPLPSDSPLWTLDNVLISPHSADQTADSHERAMAFFRHNLERFRRGEPLENVVDKAAGY